MQANRNTSRPAGGAEDNNDRSPFLAVDLGATSGRTILGRLSGGRVETEELTRFDNPIVHCAGHDYWDLLALYNEVVKALKEVAGRHLRLRSIGIDTWGCDFALIGGDGQLLASPLSYRDPHTAETLSRYFAEAVGKETVYEKTGIQFMNFNSLFQLYQMQQDGNAALGAARKILFTPDALTFLLTGEAVCEYTIASTSQLLNPRQGDLDERLLASAGLSRDQFGALTQPGTVVGTLRPDLRQLTGLGAVPVVAVAGHDTASAVAAVPARDAHFAYLSSGTWSLMGIESATPIINKESYTRNFTNEGGVEGTTRFLKNICGMWLYERCRKEWTGDTSHRHLLQAAAEAEHFRSLVNPDDPCFANPERMTAAIDAYCDRTRQPRPRNEGEYCRCIFDSLVLRYRQVFGWLRAMAGFDITTLHIIGGGSLNDALSQATADSCGVSVVAGPQECTAFGNILMQAKAVGAVADRWAMRRVVAASVETKTFQPKDKDLYDRAFEKYLAVTGHAES